MNVPSSRVARRTFLKRIAAAGLFPTIIPASALGRSGTVAPSNRIRMGLIGCGGHGTSWNLDRMFENPDQQVVAVCDVDGRHAAEAERRVNEHYSKALGMPYRCDVFRDFRDLINRKDIDAVDVATPDHWHVLPALMATRAKKHVICEKPLSLTLAEGRQLADESARSGLVFQTASENRSIDSYIQIVELVRGGYIGELRHVKVMLPKDNEARGNEDFTVQPPPKELDYDFWQGQAPIAPYCPARVHNTFRWNLAYSGGRITDWGAHLFDLAQWASGHERTGPVEVEGTGTFPPGDSVWNTAGIFDVRYRYSSGLTMHAWSEGTPGVKFEGTEGWVMFRGWRAPLTASDPKVLDVVIPESKRAHRPTVICRRDAASGPAGGEHLDFTDAIKNNKPTYAPAEIGHRTISIAHIANIAMRLGRKLGWDPDKEEFVGDAEANAMRAREQREPWTPKNVDAWLNVS
ncbi:MAG: Gfo/Idh/MocA family oxidoreductase [Planctomycetes bacterium]|nr:Gfo/Idh/MocA family oxidoreductase [Planctomycetota bacterium]